MEVLPTVIEAEYRGGYSINLKFSDGVEQTIDFEQWLEGPVFEPLKDVSYFQRFFLDGGTVAWPNGADIAPETLHERARSSETANSDAGQVQLELTTRDGFQKLSAQK